MPLATLRARADEITTELAELKQQPYWRDRWLDNTKGRKGQYYTRLAWSVPGERYANGKPKKRRQTLKTVAEVAEHTQRIERGKRITSLERELEQVRQGIERTESAIAALVG